MGAGQQSTAQHGHNRGTAWAQTSKAQHSMGAAQQRLEFCLHTPLMVIYKYMSVTVMLQLVSHSGQTILCCNNELAHSAGQVRGMEDTCDAQANTAHLYSILYIYFNTGSSIYIEINNTCMVMVINMYCINGSHTIHANPLL